MPKTNCMIVLYVVGSMIALILIIAAIVGTGWTFERSVLINAPASKVWDNISTLKALNNWNPWMDKDPNIRTEFTGIDGTPGASYTWDSDVKSVGAGKQTITNIDANKQMDTRVVFVKPFAGTGDALIQLKEEAGSTRTTWKMVSSTPYPMNFVKIFGLIEKNMDKDFTSGLSKLKRLSES